MELLTLPLALPAFAVLKDRVSFTIPQTAVVLQTGTAPGVKSFLVATNSSFAIISENAAIEMDITVSLSGEMNGLAYGSKSQAPGALSACNVPASPKAARIYTAYKKTAARRGTPQEQAVMVTVTYDPAFTPNLSVVTMDAAREQNALLAMPCEFKAG